MKKVISILISVIMLLNTTLAYTLTLTIAGVEMTTTWEEGDEVTIESKMEKIVGWKVKSGDIELVNNKFTMPNEDVEIEALMKYQLTVENMYVTTKEEKTQDQSVTITATSNEDNVFATWTAEGITLSATEIVSPTITFNMPGNDVTLTANYLTLGSYITYVPSQPTATVYGRDSGAIVADMTYTGSEGYEITNEEITSLEGAQNGPDSGGIRKITETSERMIVNQKFYPSQTRSWRLLKNNNGQLDIISAESVGALALRGVTGYKKVTYILNNLCKAYQDDVYSMSARSIGYIDGSSQEIIEEDDILDYSKIENMKEKVPVVDVLSTAFAEKCEETYPYNDNTFLEDYNQICKVAKSSGYGGFNNKHMWSSSRAMSYSGNSFYFSLNYFTAFGYTGGPSLFANSGSYWSYGESRDVFPIVSLKPEVKITGGAGTVDSPFTISID